jgi:hypothetical protein
MGNDERMARLQRGRIRELVRQFKENGMKMMLEHPANVRDLLSLLDTCERCAKPS